MKKTTVIFSWQVANYGMDGEKKIDASELSFDLFHWLISRVLFQFAYVAIPKSFQHLDEQSERFVVVASITL